MNLLDVDYIQIMDDDYTQTLFLIYKLIKCIQF